MEDITIGLISAGLSNSALDDGRSLDGDRADILAKILTGERERVLSSCSDDDDVAMMLSAFVQVEVAVSISSKELLLRLLRRAALRATFVTDVTVLVAFVEVKVMAVSISSKSKVLPLRLLRRAACRATFGTVFELLLLKELVLGGWRTCCIMRGDADLVFGVCAGSGRCCTCCCSLPRSGSRRLISNKETHVNRWSGSRYAW